MGKIVVVESFLFSHSMLVVFFSLLFVIIRVLQILLSLDRVCVCFYLVNFPTFTNWLPPTTFHIDRTNTLRSVFAI